MIKRHTWRQVVLVLAALACVVMPLICGLGALGVRQGTLVPPNVSLELGDVRLVGITSSLPDCPRLLAPGCGTANQQRPTRIYTLWLLSRQQQNAADRSHIRQLLSLRLGD